MRHLDLFSGIGGFAYAADQVWDDVEHIFCDNDKFCRAVLKKHWPESEIFDDIKAITDTERKGWWQRPVAEKGQTTRPDNRPDLLTGGFPCQPFSAAGLRRGTADERHLWPEMLRVIRLTQPTWVIAENVRGLITWSEGLVFEQVCTDLEAAGYEVQPFIVPAVAVNAPHRRDRIWFIGHAKHDGFNGTQNTKGGPSGINRDESGPHKLRQPERTDSIRKKVAGRGPHPATDWTLQPGRDATNSRHQRQTLKELQTTRDEQYSWNRNWPEVAAQFCSVDDGLSVELDGLKLSKSQHRREQLKAYGNAIVPQIAIEIMKGMTPLIEELL